MHQPSVRSWAFTDEWSLWVPNCHSISDSIALSATGGQLRRYRPIGLYGCLTQTSEQASAPADRRRRATPHTIAELRAKGSHIYIDRSLAGPLSPLSASRFHRRDRLTPEQALVRPCGYPFAPLEPQGERRTNPSCAAVWLPNARQKLNASERTDPPTTSRLDSDCAAGTRAPGAITEASSNLPWLPAARAPKQGDRRPVITGMHHWYFIPCIAIREYS